MFTLCIYIIYIINFIAVLLLIFFENKQPSSILMWSVVLFFIPVLGLILYLLFGKSPSLDTKKRLLKRCNDNIRYKDLIIEQLKSVKNSNLNNNIKEFATFNLNNGNLYSSDNNIEIFSEVKNYYDDMLKEIENAKSSVYAEFYRIRNDKIGIEFVELLAKKAYEGLSVKIIYDDLGCLNLKKDFFDCVRNCGGKVFSFYPSKFIILKRNINYRNHRKLLVIDNAIAYIGGSNIGMEYLGKKENINPFIDCNVKLTGTAAMHLNYKFFEDYCFATKQNKKIELKKQNFDGDIAIQILSNAPDTTKTNIMQAYLKAIYNAKKRIYIQTPYLIPDRPFILAIINAVKSGVDVKIMIPKKPDKQFVYYATLYYASLLIKNGVKIYARNGFLHSKTLIIDDDIASIGSFNIDIRSFYLQFEITSFIYDSNINQKLNYIFDNDLKYCTLLDNDYIRKKPLKQKILEKIMRLFTPIM